MPQAYMELQLCREFHVLPSELGREPVLNVLRVLTMMDVEAKVRKARNGK